MAAEAAATMKKTHTRPSTTGEPTAIDVSAYLIDIIKLSEADQTFQGDFMVRVSWKDPRLADANSKATRAVSMSEIWNPRLTIVNRREGKILYPEMAEVDSKGLVVYTQRIMGVFSNPMNLRDFPLDKQVLFIDAVARGYGTDQIRFQPNHTRIGREPKLNLSGWNTGAFSARTYEKHVAFHSGKGSQVLAGVHFEVTATRNWRYYTLREILPLLFIVLMASALFWLPADEHKMKAGISTAAIFSLMAFYVRLGSSMPRLDYLTRMDTFVVGSIVLVFLSFTQVVLGMYLFKSNQEAKAVTLDKWSRAIYPLALAMIVGVAFFS